MRSWTKASKPKLVFRSQAQFCNDFTLPQPEVHHAQEQKNIPFFHLKKSNKNTSPTGHVKQTRDMRNMPLTTRSHFNGHGHIGFPSLLPNSPSCSPPPPRGPGQLEEVGILCADPTRGVQQRLRGAGDEDLGVAETPRLQKTWLLFLGFLLKTQLSRLVFAWSIFLGRFGFPG